MKDFSMDCRWEAGRRLSVNWMTRSLLAGISGWLLMMPLVDERIKEDEQV